MSQKQRILDLLEDVRAEVEDLEQPEMVPPGDRVPMQPLVMDGSVVRFRENKVVAYVLKCAERSGCDMNHLGSMAFMGMFSREDQSQFAQLIGYSVSGYGDLGYALGVAEADAAAEKMGRER